MVVVNSEVSTFLATRLSANSAGMTLLCQEPVVLEDRDPIDPLQVVVTSVALR